MTRLYFRDGLNNEKLRCIETVIPLVIFMPYNDKIADITHADTNLHTLDLAAALGDVRKIIAVIVGAQRIGGTGYFRVYPNEGATMILDQGLSKTTCLCMIANGTNRLQYSLSVASDDFDLYCFGYVVEA